MTDPVGLTCLFFIFFFAQKQPCIIICFFGSVFDQHKLFYVESRFLFGPCEYALLFVLWTCLYCLCDLTCTSCCFLFSFGICTTIYYQLDLYFYLPSFLLRSQIRHHRNYHLEIIRRRDLDYAPSIQFGDIPISPFRVIFGCDFCQWLYFVPSILFGVFSSIICGIIAHYR